MEKTATEKRERRTKRRGNGEGSIYQRKDNGLWTASVVIGRNQNGRMVRKYVYGATKGDVQKKLAKLLPQQQAGIIGQGDRITVGEYLDKWLEHVQANNRASTYASYRQIAKKHIRPFIGGMKLAKLVPLNIEALYSALRSARRSPRIVQMAHAVLHRALQTAVGKQIPSNPCDGVERPRAEKKDFTPLQPEQLGAFLSEIDGNRLKALYLTAIATGLRWGELLGLQWSDVELNPERASASVRRIVVEIEGEFIVNKPKTPKSRRSVFLPPVAVEALCEHRTRMMREGHAGSPWVFVSRNGKHIRRTVIRKSLRSILKAAKLPMIRFHDLRHTCATLMILDGTHLKVVQEQLGHSSGQLTIDTYSHVIPTMQREATDRLGDRLKASVG